MSNLGHIKWTKNIKPFHLLLCSTYAITCEICGTHIKMLQHIFISCFSLQEEKVMIWIKIKVNKWKVNWVNFDFLVCFHFPLSAQASFISILLHPLKQFSSDTQKYSHTLIPPSSSGWLTVVPPVTQMTHLKERRMKSVIWRAEDCASCHVVCLVWICGRSLPAEDLISAPLCCGSPSVRLEELY